MPALLVAALMAWAGWVWAPFPSVAWVLAELPAAVFTVGLLLRHFGTAAVRAYVDIAVDRAPRWPRPGVVCERPRIADGVLPVAQADVMPPVVSLQEYRERKAA